MCGLVQSDPAQSPKPTTAMERRSEIKWFLNRSVVFLSPSQLQPSVAREDAEISERWDSLARLPADCAKVELLLAGVENGRPDHRLRGRSGRMMTLMIDVASGRGVHVPAPPAGGRGQLVGADDGVSPGVAARPRPSAGLRTAWRASGMGVLIRGVGQNPRPQPARQPSDIPDVGPAA